MARPWYPVARGSWECSGRRLSTPKLKEDGGRLDQSHFYGDQNDKYLRSRAEHMTMMGKWKPVYIMFSCCYFVVVTTITLHLFAESWPLPSDRAHLFPILDAPHLVIDYQKIRRCPQPHTAFQLVPGLKKRSTSNSILFVTVLVSQFQKVWFWNIFIESAGE